VGGAVLTLAVASGAVLLLLLFLASYDEASINQGWDTLLNPAGRRAYEELRSRFDRERNAIDFSYGRAEQARDGGDAEEAGRLLAVGYEYLAQLAPDRERLLDGLRLYSRMCAAIVPLPPLRPNAFRLPELATLAGLAWLAHHLLVTIPDRFRLRLDLLRRGLGIALKALLQGSERRRKGQPDPDWTRLLAARADFHSISDETLESFAALVSALVRQPATAAALQRVH
jgi:hypothetical protein